MLEYDKKRYTNIIDNLEINGQHFFDNISDFLKMFIDSSDRIIIKAFIDFVKKKEKDQSNVIFQKYISRYLRNIVKKIIIPCILKRDNINQEIKETQNKEFVEFVIKEADVNLEYEDFLNENNWNKDVYDYYYGKIGPNKPRILNNQNIFTELGIEGDKYKILNELYNEHGDDNTDFDLIMSCIYLLYGLISEKHTEIAKFFFHHMEVFDTFKDHKTFHPYIIKLLWCTGYSGDMDFFNYFTINICDFYLLNEKECVLEYIIGAIEGGNYDIVEKHIIAYNSSDAYPFKFDENDYSKMFRTSIRGGDLRIVDYLIDYFEYIEEIDIKYIQYAYHCGSSKNMDVIDYIYTKIDGEERIHFLIQACHGAINACYLYTLLYLFEKMMNIDNYDEL